MKSKAELTIQGRRHEIVRCEYSLHREIDTNGKPISNVCGGHINLEVIYNEDGFMIEAMLKSHLNPFDGNILFKIKEKDTEPKELSFKNASIMNYHEGMEKQSDGLRTIKFTLSAEFSN